MPLYDYRCERCGDFELERAMGTAPRSQRCARCGADAQRRYAAPHLNRTPRPLADALTRAEKSRDEPEVVTRVPPGPRPPRASDPPLKQLPRY